MLKLRARFFLAKWFKSAIEDKKQNGKETKLVDIIFNKVGGFEYFLSFSTKFVQTKLPDNITQFWKTAAKTWIELKQKDNEPIEYDLSTILGVPLFNNNDIRYKGNPLFFNKWVSAGIKNLHHIIDKGKMKTIGKLEQVIGKYGGLHFDYYAILNAIPTKWK